MEGRRGWGKRGMEVCTYIEGSNPRVVVIEYPTCIFCYTVRSFTTQKRTGMRRFVGLEYYSLYFTKVCFVQIVAATFLFNIVDIERACKQCSIIKIELSACLLPIREIGA